MAAAFGDGVPQGGQSGMTAGGPRLDGAPVPSAVPALGDLRAAPPRPMTAGLRTQHLVSPFAVSAREAVGSLLAVQAENPGQAAWAVASRTQNPDQADLAALLDDGAVLRTHVLRPTWHFVRAEDIGWLLDLTGPRLQRVTGQQLRNAHGLDERSVGHAIAAVTQALADRGQLTRGQLADELGDRGIAGSGQMLMIRLAHAELGGLICSGR